MDIRDFMQRYIIESRGRYMGSGTRAWLVVYDVSQEQYLRVPGNPRKYMEFNNSNEIIEYILNMEEE